MLSIDCLRVEDLYYLVTPNMSMQIVCPKCNFSISIDEAVSHRYEEQYKLKYQAEADKKIEEEKRKLWKIAQEKAAEKMEAQKLEEFKILKQENDKKDQELKEAKEFELKLRQEKNDLEKEKADFQLKLQRQLDEDRIKIREEVSKKAMEERQFEISQMKKQLEDTQKALEEARRKSEQASQQLQGEILELELEQALLAEFPSDQISPVEKGIRGADVVQVVRDSLGKVCGTIVWESKRTKNFEEGWTKILKDNTLRVRGDASVLVTKVMPKDCNNFVLRDGVYITNFECAIEVARVLRDALIRICFAKTASTGKNEKMEMVYGYITSTQFTQKVSSMLEAYASMKNSLDREKIAMAKMWAQREKEIERLQISTAGIYGELQGLAGAEIENVDLLELPTGDNFEEVVSN